MRRVRPGGNFAYRGCSTWICFDDDDISEKDETRFMDISSPVTDLHLPLRLYSLNSSTPRNHSGTGSSYCPDTNFKSPNVIINLKSCYYSLFILSLKSLEAEFLDPYLPYLSLNKCQLEIRNFLSILPLYFKLFNSSI